MSSNSDSLDFKARYNLFELETTHLLNELQRKSANMNGTFSNKILTLDEQYAKLYKRVVFIE